jgi:LysR family transcriptional regulator for bpeEF and oprC
MAADLNRIELFREVVLAGSFSRAATRLRMPKSRVSRHIASLESALGVPLIYRTTRQFRLTQAGTELFQKTAPLLSELNTTLEALRTGAEEVAGLIRVTVPEDIGVELLGPLCREFLALYPKVELAVHASNQLVDLVREQIDVAVRIGPARDSTMTRKLIGHVRLIFVAAPELLSRFGPATTLAQLEKLPFLSFSPLGQNRITLDVSNTKEKRKLRLRASFGSNNFFVLRSMARAGTGFAPLPAFLARDDLRQGTLVQLAGEWQLESSPVQILLPKQRATPPKIRAFVEFLAERLAPRL